MGSKPREDPSLVYPQYSKTLPYDTFVLKLSFGTKINVQPLSWFLVNSDDRLIKEVSTVFAKRLILLLVKYFLAERDKDKFQGEQNIRVSLANFNSCN